MIGKTLHIKLQIEQHKPHYKCFILQLIVAFETVFLFGTMHIWREIRFSINGFLKNILSELSKEVRVILKFQRRNKSVNYSPLKQ